jgi:hypothetical protein
VQRVLMPGTEFESWAVLVDARVSALPMVEPSCSAGSVSRKLSALTSFCGFHARRGVEGLLITMQPTAGHGPTAVVSAASAPCVQTLG